MISKLHQSLSQEKVNKQSSLSILVVHFAWVRPPSLAGSHDLVCALSSGADCEVYSLICYYSSSSNRSIRILTSLAYSLVFGALVKPSVEIRSSHFGLPGFEFCSYFFVPVSGKCTFWAAGSNGSCI